MANALYDKGRQKFLEGSIAWLSNNIKFVLIDAADYTVDLANHDALDDIPGAARVATSANATTKTSTSGIADCDDPTFTAVTGDQSEAVVFYVDSGTESTSWLIGYLDTISGLPITPSGTDIVLQIDNGTNKLFKL